MKENLIKNLGFVQIIRIDLDILLQKISFMIKINSKNVVKFYELRCFMVKKLVFNAKSFKILNLAEIKFVNVGQKSELYFISLKLAKSEINMKITCKKFEWNFLIEEDFVVELGTF